MRNALVDNAGSPLSGVIFSIIFKMAVVSESGSKTYDTTFVPNLESFEELVKHVLVYQVPLSPTLAAIGGCTWFAWTQ